MYYNRNAILDHSLPGVHGALLVGISIALRYSYSVGLSIAVVLAGPPSHKRNRNDHLATKGIGMAIWPHLIGLE